MSGYGVGFPPIYACDGREEGSGSAQKDSDTGKPTGSASGGQSAIRAGSKPRKATDYHNAQHHYDRHDSLHNNLGRGVKVSIKWLKDHFFKAQEDSMQRRAEESRKPTEDDIKNDELTTLFSKTHIGTNEELNKLDEVLHELKLKKNKKNG
jgi:hypothetical protein